MDISLKGFIGQTQTKELLISVARSGRVSHAYIFEGESGMGKKTLAYAFARQLVCKTGDFCGSCTGCKLSVSGNHPDIITVKPDEGKQNISVENIRNLYETIMVKPYSADKKIIIIPGAEHLGIPAQNALLKMLEEPPSYVVFLLLTTNSNYFLETVLSRCIKLTFTPYTESEMALALKENGISNAAPEVIASSGGRPGRAIELISGGTFLALRRQVISMFDLFFDDRASAFEIAAFIEENKEYSSDIFDIFSFLARELVMYRIGVCTKVSDNDFSPEKYLERTSVKGCMAFLDKVTETKKMLLSNVNFSLLANCFAVGGREVLSW